MESCIHHWIIDQDFNGICRKCPATKDFSPETTKPLFPNWGQRLEHRQKSFWGGGRHNNLNDGWNGGWDNAVKIYEANREELREGKDSH